MVILEIGEGWIAMISSSTKLTQSREGSIPMTMTIYKLLYRLAPLLRTARPSVFHWSAHVNVVWREEQLKWIEVPRGAHPPS